MPNYRRCIGRWPVWCHATRQSNRGHTRVTSTGAMALGKRSLDERDLHPHIRAELLQIGSDRELYGDDGVRQSKQESKISTRWSAESEQPHQTPLKDFTRHEREQALQRENAEARAVVLRAAAAREAMLREERGLTACHDGFVFANWLPPPLPPPPPPPLSPRRLACSLSLPLARCLRYLLCSASATASPSLPAACALWPSARARVCA